MFLHGSHFVLILFFHLLEIFDLLDSCSVAEEHLVDVISYDEITFKAFECLVKVFVFFFELKHLRLALLQFFLQRKGLSLVAAAIESLGISVVILKRDHKAVI